MQLKLGSVAAKIPATAKLFVYVRQVGQRMPIGVQQFSLDALPGSVSFSTDRDYRQVEVVARISATGKVERSPSDVETQALAQFSVVPEAVILKFDAPISVQSQIPTTDRPIAAADRLITVQVSENLPEQVAKRLSKDAAVFVIAKAPGRPIPLAVKRMRLADLPARITLSENDSMMPGHSIATVDEVVVSARISPSGDASRSKGDWEGYAADSTAAVVEISINTAIDI